MRKTSRGKREPQTTWNTRFITRNALIHHPRSKGDLLWKTVPCNFLFLLQIPPNSLHLPVRLTSGWIHSDRDFPQKLWQSGSKSLLDSALNPAAPCQEGVPMTMHSHESVWTRWALWNWVMLLFGILLASQAKWSCFFSDLLARHFGTFEIHIVSENVGRNVEEKS